LRRTLVHWELMQPLPKRRLKRIKFLCKKNQLGLFVGDNSDKGGVDVNIRQLFFCKPLCRMQAFVIQELDN